MSTTQFPLKSQHYKTVKYNEIQNVTVSNHLNLILHLTKYYILKIRNYKIIIFSMYAHLW